MAPTVESHGRRIVLESDPYVGSWRRKQAEKGIDDVFLNRDMSV